MANKCACKPTDLGAEIAYLKQVVTEHAAFMKRRMAEHHEFLRGVCAQIRNLEKMIKEKGK